MSLSLDSLVDVACSALQQEGEEVQVAIMLPGDDGYTTFLFDIEASLLRVTEDGTRPKVVFALRMVEADGDRPSLLI